MIDTIKTILLDIEPALNIGLLIFSAIYMINSYKCKRKKDIEKSNNNLLEAILCIALVLL